jgi:N-acetylglucosamine malate deacetylase 1
MQVASVMAHQDDELVCLGTMLKMRARGDALHFICVSDGSGGMAHLPEMPREQAAAVRRVEMSDLARRLGASYTCLDAQDEFVYDTPDLRERLLGAIRACGADVVFTHFSPDYNLDHMTVNALVRQCALHASLPMQRTEAPPLATTPAVFMVEPSGGFEFEPSHYVDVTDLIDEKTALALCHRSQDEAFRAALGKGLDDWVREQTRFRGAQAGVEHAEAFRPMLARGLVKPYAILP